jgi:hypothetical protein
MKIFHFIILCCLLNCSFSVAQEVEHNYKVGPKYIDCDSLDINDLSQAETIALIRKSKFRFNQSFQLRRKQGLQLGEFYSCDNMKGYLIIKYDEKEQLYLQVEKLIWDEFISSSDPEGYYLKIKPQLQNHD